MTSVTGSLWLECILQATISFVMGLGFGREASEQLPFRIGYPAYAFSVELLRCSDQHFF